MKQQEFEQFLHQQIPITEAMGFCVTEFTPDRVCVRARLEPNRNHKGTAFGGSISCLMIACGWSMVFANLKPLAPDAHIVIQKSSIQYLRPITEDFTAVCEITDTAAREVFFTTYQKRQKARWGLQVRCYKDGELLAEYEGQYVAYA